jgi:hypothetical protein
MYHIIVRSPSFDTHQKIPRKYTCDGEDINPPLKINNIPSIAKSIVVMMEDPDAPVETIVHWILMGIDPSDAGYIPEGMSPGILGRNDFGRIGYSGPCPPSGTHRYFFRVFVLDWNPRFMVGSTKEEVFEEMKDHIMARGELVGKYSKY